MPVKFKTKRGRQSNELVDEELRDYLEDEAELEKKRLKEEARKIKWEEKQKKRESKRKDITLEPCYQSKKSEEEAIYEAMIEEEKRFISGNKMMKDEGVKLEGETAVAEVKQKYKKKKKSKNKNKRGDDDNDRLKKKKKTSSKKSEKIKIACGESDGDKDVKATLSSTKKRKKKRKLAREESSSVNSVIVPGMDVSGTVSMEQLLKEAMEKMRAKKSKADKSSIQVANFSPTGLTLAGPSSEC